MKKICSLFTFILCSTLMASDAVISQPLPTQQLIDIQLELSYLRSKRNYLIDKISSAHHSEVNEEVRSMMQMREYHWSSFVSDIKDAKKNERIAKVEELELHEIDEKILKLKAEVTTLLALPH